MHSACAENLSQPLSLAIECCSGCANALLPALGWRFPSRLLRLPRLYVLVSVSGTGQVRVVPLGRVPGGARGAKGAPRGLDEDVQDRGPVPVAHRVPRDASPRVLPQRRDDRGLQGPRRRALEAILRRGQAERVIRPGDPEFLIAFLWGAFLGLFKPALDRDGRVDEGLLLRGEALAWAAVRA